MLLLCELDLFPAEWEMGIRMSVRLQQEFPIREWDNLLFPPSNLDRDASY